MNPPVINFIRPVHTNADNLWRIVNADHPGAALLAYVSRLHPEPALRSQLILSYTSRETPHRAAALEWHVMRIDDYLPYAGFTIEPDGAEHFRLQAISERRFARLVEKHEQRNRERHMG